MYTVEKSAKTIEEAIRLALQELGVEEDETKVEVLSVPSKGFLGIGNKNALVRVTTLEYIEEQEIVAKAKEIALQKAEEEAAKIKKAEIKVEPKAQPKATVKAEPKAQPKKVVETEVEKEAIVAQPKKEDVITIIQFDSAQLEIFKKKAHDFLRGTLENMGLKAEIKIRFEENRMNIELAGPNMGIIIGRHGQTLDAIQYLTNLVVNKENLRENFIKVSLDTEGYRSKREDILIAMAKTMAAQVLSTGRKVKLEPMNPYERRIVHSALQEFSGITTFSEDQEPYRHIVIAKE